MESNVLWTSFKQIADPDVKKQIIMNYTNLVHYVIHNSKFMTFNIMNDKDYFQFGIEGLSEAIDRFDPSVGTKFETYAIQRIRGKIIDELRKIQIKPRVSNSDNNIFYSNVSLFAPVSEDESCQLYEILPDNKELPDELLNRNEIKDLLFKAIENLDEKEKLILTLYYYENLNYKEIAKILDVTVSRISQLHGKIINKLREDIKVITD
ncbi:MAG: sigma-70 family RNA polymerase sigma factor [Ignavibacteriales bacterium]|nr:MAG: sigma-70 family RNA polymerase sigma factor [Ignavibacteriales bacterium]